MFSPLFFLLISLVLLPLEATAQTNQHQQNDTSSVRYQIPNRPTSSEGSPTENLSSNEDKKKLSLVEQMRYGLNAIQAIDIVSIEQLQLKKKLNGYVLDTCFTFTNSSYFPLRIISGSLIGVINPPGKEPVHIGQIQINKGVTLLPSTKDKLVKTQLKVLVDYSDSLRRLIPIAQLSSLKKENIKLFLSVEGSLNVKIELLAGLSIEKEVEVMLDFTPSMNRKIAEQLKIALIANGISDVD